MLSKRFICDGKPATDLEGSQIKARNKIEEKINEGVYPLEGISCCICHNNNFNVLSEKDKYGLYCPIVICRECGLIQANPRMTEDAFAKFYDAEYSMLYRNPDFLDKYWFHQTKRGERIYNYLKKNLRIDISGLRVFEVGAGMGGVLSYFKEKGNEVYGCDLDSQFISFGKNKFNLNLEVGTLEDIVLPWTPDIIIYSHVLEHILDPLKELEILRSVIDDNTVVYVEVPGLKHMMDFCGGDFLNWIQNAHVYYFTQKTLRNLMEKAGYNFVCGNNYINSIFKKSKTQMRNEYESDYGSSMFFLQIMEYYRVVPIFYKIKIMKRSFMPSLINLLKKVGLYDISKKVFYKFK